MQLHCYKRSFFIVYIKNSSKIIGNTIFFRTFVVSKSYSYCKHIAKYIDI